MQSVEELYANAIAVVPEPGMHEEQVRRMLHEAVDFSEGVTVFLAQATLEMLRELLSKRHTYHDALSDFDFLERLHAALSSR